MAKIDPMTDPMIQRIYEARDAFEAYRNHARHAINFTATESEAIYVMAYMVEAMRAMEERIILQDREIAHLKRALGQGQWS